MADQALFSRPVVIVMVACATIALVLSIWFQIYHTQPYRATVGSSTYSRSALGHMIFYETLRKLDWPVTRSAKDVAEGAGNGGVLIMAEPDLDLLRARSGTGKGDRLRTKSDSGKGGQSGGHTGSSNAAGNERVDVSGTILLVLPKRYGFVDYNNRAWVRRVESIGLEHSAKVLNLFTSGAGLVRGSLPARWTTSTLGVEPQITADLQLIRKPPKPANGSVAPAVAAITPLIENDEGILLGELRDGRRRILVLSDPDPIENHAITKGDNAKFAVALLERLRRADGRLVFDESVHELGYGSSSSGDRDPHKTKAGPRPGDSQFRVLLEFPFSLLMAQLALTTLLLLWATVARFGPAEKLAALAISFGKTRLIENTAALLGAAGHQTPTLRRYLLMVQRETARALHAPKGLDGAAQVEWLDKIGKARGVSHNLSAIIGGKIDRGGESGAVASLYATARAIHSWSKEILNGAARGKADR